MKQEYSEMSGTLARAAGVSQFTVQAYADAGLLDFIWSTNRQRLFRSGQAEKVRQIYRERAVRRGRAPVGIEAA